MTRKQSYILGAAIDIPAIILFGYFTNIWAAVALFFALYANNLSQS